MTVAQLVHGNMYQKEQKSDLRVALRRLDCIKVLVRNFINYLLSGTVDTRLELNTERDTAGFHIVSKYGLVGHGGW